VYWGWLAVGDGALQVGQVHASMQHADTCWCAALFVLLAAFSLPRSFCRFL